MGTKYSSVKEMISDMNKKEKERRRKNPLKYYVEVFWYRIICNTWDVPGNFYRECKWFIQRGKRGWSDRDVWSIDGFLEEIMPPMLKQLKETKHGVPNKLIQEAYEELTGKTDNYYYQHDNELDNKIMNLAEKNFNTILDHISWTFEIAQKIQDEDYILWYEGKKPTTLNFTTDISKEDTEKFYKGFDLFKEHFFDLWD